MQNSEFIFFVAGYDACLQCFYLHRHVNVMKNEPRREKTGFLHMRKQRRRSASR